MPGTIQVSVLGFVDLPQSEQSPSTSSSSKECPSGLVSLKVAMGKTEYQTWDKGDFSFPLTSLRENLKLTLLDADGNEISRTDVKTTVVVEKRCWDALFPLEGGGCIHLKLQFVLNAEEHKRIREMREAVLKRRHGELPKSDFKDSVADNTIGSSASFTTEGGHLANQLPVKSQDRRGERSVASLSQDLPQHPKHHHEHDAICQSSVNESSGYQANQSDTHEIAVSLEETIDPHMRRSGFLVSGETIATSSSSFALAQEERKITNIKESPHEKSPVNNTKKLISAFENISVQEPKIHVGLTAEPWMRAIKRGGSLGISWSEGTNTQNITIQKMMSKSFSTGVLPQMKSASFGLPYAQVQEGEKHTEVAISKKNLGNNKLSIESKNVQDHEKLDLGNKKAVSKFLPPAQSPRFEITSDTLETIETKEVNICISNDIIRDVDQYPSDEAKAGPPKTFRLKEHDTFQEKVVLGSVLEGVSFLDSETSNENLDVTVSHCFEKEGNMHGNRDHMLHNIDKGSNQMVKDPSVCGEYQGGSLESFDGRELVHKYANRKDEETSMKDSTISSKLIAKPEIEEKLSRLPMHQGQLKPSIPKADSGFSASTRDDVYEITTFGSSDLKLDITYFDVGQCLLGSYDNSMPRHFCITSGSKQLKDIIGGFVSI